MSGFELLERIHQDRDIADLPISVYTGRELTHDEELELKRYADSIYSQRGEIARTTAG